MRILPAGPRREDFWVRQRGRRNGQAGGLRMRAGLAHGERDVGPGWREGSRHRSLLEAGQEEGRQQGEQYGGACEPSHGRWRGNPPVGRAIPAGGVKYCEWSGLGIEVGSERRLARPALPAKARDLGRGLVH